jgi:hypothetical protein
MEQSLGRHAEVTRKSSTIMNFAWAVGPNDRYRNTEKMAHELFIIDI